MTLSHKRDNDKKEETTVAAYPTSVPVPLAMPGPQSTEVVNTNEVAAVHSSSLPAPLPQPTSAFVLTVYR